MAEAPEDKAVARVLTALAAGNARPLAQLFRQSGQHRVVLLQTLLDHPDDANVAEAFSLIWEGLSPEFPAELMGFLRWYLTNEPWRGPGFPLRRAVLNACFANVLSWDPWPPGVEAAEFGAVLAGIVLQQGGAAGLRGRATRLLRRLDLAALPLTADLVRAAIHAADLSLLRPMLDRWPEGPLPQDLRSALNWAMWLVMEFDGISPWLGTVIQRQFDRDPQDPVAVQHWVQLQMHQGQPFSALAAAMKTIRLDPSNPDLASVLEYFLWHAEAVMDEALSRHFRKALKRPTSAKPLPTGAPIQDEDRVPWQPPPPGATLLELVDAAEALSGEPLLLAGPWTERSMERAFANLVEAAGTAAVHPEFGIEEALKRANLLRQLDLREFSWVTHFHRAPHAHGAPRFGLINLRLIPVVHRGLMAIQAALTAAVIRRYLDWDTAGNLGTLAALLHMHGKACVDAGTPGAAQALLDLVASQDLLPDIVAIERDNLALNGGTPVPLGQASMTRLDTTPLPFLDHARWTRAEAIYWQPLARDESVVGTFIINWPSGVHERARHLTPTGRVEQARIQGLRLVSEDFLIGPLGNVLRPDAYHTNDEFPWPSAHMVAAGQTHIRLRPLAQHRIEEPVLVLEAFEALRWRNYFHWMVPILSRIALAKDSGLLDERRLVIPAGLSSWMHETLALLGLSEDRLLVLPLGHEAKFSDALLISSIEHISPTCIAALRRCLLGEAAADPVRPDGPVLYLSRKGQKLRQLVNEPAIEALAEEMGCQVIVPQDLGIAGQIRAFSQARGVVAVEGAALTNTIFAPPGIRVLALCCQNDMMPVFNDLSIILGQHHRKMAGRGLHMGQNGNQLQPAFRIKPDRVRNGLEWVMNGPAQPPEPGRAT